MFASFLMPSAFEGIRARHLLVFYKQLMALGRERAGFIGEADYFRAPQALREEGRPEFSANWQRAFDYEAPVDLKGVLFDTLADNLFDRRLQRLQSQWRLYAQLVTRRLPEVERAIARSLDRLAAFGAINAIFSFANVPSLAHVAAERALPVVYTHFGPLRSPAYVMTGYWDRRGVNSGTDVERRFERFRREIAGGSFDLLGRDELLHTVRRTPLPEVEGGQFKIGIALQGEENAYVHNLGALDLFSIAARTFAPADTLIRNHPGAIATYSDAVGQRDTSPDSASFILKCNTVMTVNSGVALEALLLGRRTVVLGDSPLRIAADRSLRSRSRDRLLALNFLVFGYLVPYALMFDPDYTTWRLTDPPELDIVRHHQDWFRRYSTLGRSHRPVAIFGAGAASKPLIARLRRDQRDVVAVFDNDREKWGSTIDGVPVSAPAPLDDACVFIASQLHGDAMSSQLQELGYAGTQIVRLG